MEAGQSQKTDIEQKLYDSIWPDMPVHKTYKIGIIGAGAIIRKCHLPSYRQAGFTVAAIASRNRSNAEQVAQEFDIAQVYTSWEELIADPQIEIVDVAVPPHIQPQIVEKCCAQAHHIKGILCQKPAAVTRADLDKMQQMCDAAGITIAVNQNMRYDQSIRALKYSMEEGLLGEPVLATLELRARSDWRDFYYDYGKVEILDLGIHHLDAMRFLFGEPSRINAVCRTDPRLTRPHKDGLSQYNLLYDAGLLVSILDDTYAGPTDCAQDIYIRWRVEGTAGIARGSIGWPYFPKRVPSTFELSIQQLGEEWMTPKWDTCWFPDAFMGTMAALMIAVERGEAPVLSLEDHSKSMACVEACYQAIAEERTVALTWE
ncbi:MAG: Gfo/Idh/MocA family protein [Lachnospiraceae bacterium]